MLFTLHLTGIHGPATPLAVADTPAIANLRQTHSFELRPAQTAPATLQLQANDVLCLRLADGLEWWMRVEEAVELFGKPMDGGNPRPASDSGYTCQLDILQGLQQLLTRHDAKPNQRQYLHSLHVLELAQQASPMDAARALEQSQYSLGQSGLHRLQLDATAPVLHPGVPTAGDALLLLLPTMLANTATSFGKLWQTTLSGDMPGPGTAQNTAAQALHLRYADAACVFEYPALSVSPIENALQLAKQLPAASQLHILSHGYGGLLGELLCLGQLQENVLTEEELQVLFEKDRTILADLEQTGGAAQHQQCQQNYQAQLKALHSLRLVLQEKKFQITRFVRVACPAQGSHLANGRLDRWLSILRHLLASSGHLALAGSMLPLLLSTLQHHSDARCLPGMEALLPGSALLRLLNRDDLQCDADLSVVAGNIEDKSALWSMRLLHTEQFFTSRHDTLINTGSMYGGLRRTQGKGRGILDVGRQVGHFHYFSNSRSVRAILAGLSGQGQDWQRFTPIQAAQRQLRSLPRAKTGARPMAILIPGVMGSHLSVEQQKVWLHLGQLILGGMGRLERGKHTVQASELMDSFYGDFLRFLQDSHQATPFVYDWRESIQHNADLLAASIEAVLPTLEQQRQPLRLLAHSMGGLVARAMLGRKPALWRRLKALPGFRLIMFGTPNFGSYQSVRMMVGEHHLPNWLALLDLFHSKQEIQSIITGFAGSTEMLPFQDRHFDFSQVATWQALRRDTGGNWPLPETTALQQFVSTRALLQNAPIDPQTMIYVAGWDRHTPSEAVLETSTNWRGEKQTHLRFYATRRGDGTVTWDAGMLPGVSTYFVQEAAHDQLMSTPQVFAAYLELIMSGSTRRLPQQEPAQVRSGADERILMPADETPYQSNLDNFGGFGGPRKRSREVVSVANIEQVRISVRHGDLAYALHPVCVGHYQGDTVVSAEKQLDAKLGGALRERAALGIYPGRLGSWSVFFAKHAAIRPGGAVVVGLGQVGELTPGLLEGSLTPALVDYALQVANWHDGRFGDRDGVRQARLSFLLIGTGAGGISLRDAVNVILRSVKKANEKLLAQNQRLRSYIDQIEILELFHDIALQAAHALKTALRDPELQDYFIWTPQEVISPGSGLHRAQFDQSQSWWQRTEISFDKKRQELRFVALTNRARAEQSLVAGQMRLAKDFVRQAIGTTAQDQDISRTLFEMLIPNRLKEFAPERQDVVLLVDEEAAWFPWEMMEDRWSESGAPPAVAAGMIRQLKLQEFRSQTLGCSDANILVVGNPRPCRINRIDLPNLEGARQEAEMVAQLFRQANFRVRAEIEQNADNILIALHGEAYRILHLAGHGVHEQETLTEDGSEACQSCEQVLAPQKIHVSGMVIGDGVFLTPADVEQMRRVPELVFLNCCHLGTTLNKNHPPRYNELAANLATQFIRMGVKAVIAAGWEVHDAAACVFAEVFYQAMLDGVEFGHAVLRARQRIYEEFSAVNTWGAYQCYGDPDFRLRPDASLPQSYTAPDYFSSLELITDLNNLTRRARFGNAEEEDVQQILERIPEDSRERWLNQADVAAALGQAYGELQLFAQAIKPLDIAIAAEKSDLPLLAIEQRANFKARRAAELALSGNPEELAHAQELFTQADSELRGLLALAPTMERYNLHASTWKRRAMCGADRSERQNCLREMAQCYQAAVKHACDKRSKPLPHSYPLLNVQLVQILQAESLPLPAAQAQQIINHCRQIYESDMMSNRESPDFWAAAILPQSMLIAALAEAKLDRETSKQILTRFKNARQPGASRRELASIYDNLQFIAIMLRDQEQGENQAMAVEKILQELQKTA